VLEIEISNPWNETGYDEALKRQRELSASGRKGWLLFCCPPTITLGTRGHFSDVLMPMDELKRRGVRLLPVDRGGQVTYHGPGQVIGFPFGRLEDFTGDSRGVRRFVLGLQGALEDFIKAELERAGDTTRVLEHGDEACSGVWLHDQGLRRKIVAMGMAFGREGVRHGFALNVLPVDEGFELVNPCGEIGARTAALLGAGGDFAGVRERLTARLAAAMMN
jgi:lipoyl(octanoyl) transferase